MAIPRIPSLTLPTSNFDEMLAMSNRRLIGVLRTAVFAPEKMTRFSPRPPEEHDAYVVRHEPKRIVIRLFANGEEVFRCNLIPDQEYS